MENQKGLILSGTIWPQMFIVVQSRDGPKTIYHSTSIWVIGSTVQTEEETLIYGTWEFTFWLYKYLTWFIFLHSHPNSESIFQLKLLVHDLASDILHVASS